MSCIITYKNKQYTELEFKNYFDSNIKEFNNILGSKQDIEGFTNFVNKSKTPKRVFKENEVTLNEKSEEQILFGLNNENKNDLEFNISILNKISQFLENVGVEQRLIPEFLSKDGSIIEGALAAANFIEGTVDIIEDLQKRPLAWNKLPEEAAHWWYRLLSVNSSLKRDLLQNPKVNEKIKELVGTQYENLYTNEGLTEEAIGQLIAEAIKRIEDKTATLEDKSFFTKFIQWINSLINNFKSKEEDSFEIAAIKILNSDLSDLMTAEEYLSIINEASDEFQQYDISENIKEEVGLEVSSVVPVDYFKFLQKKFKTGTKYLKKTIARLQAEINVTTNVLTKPFTEENSKNLNDIKLTFYPKLELAQKYKNGVPLTSPIGLTTAKKEDLQVINFVKKQILEENPNLKTIPVLDFIKEVDNYLNTIYSLKSKNLKKWQDYRISNTFSEKIEKITHNKIGIYVNNEYFLDQAHFSENPFAWYTITPYNKDSVLLHEYQTDFLDQLDKYKTTESNNITSKSNILSKFVTQNDSYFAQFSREISNKILYNSSIYERFKHRIEELSYINNEINVKKAYQNKLDAKAKLDKFYSDTRVIENYFNNNLDLMETIGVEWFELGKTYKNDSETADIERKNFIDNYNNLIAKDIQEKYERTVDLSFYLRGSLAGKFNKDHFLKNITNRSKNKLFLSAEKHKKINENQNKIAYFSLASSTKKYDKIKSLKEKEFQKIYENLSINFNSIEGLLENSTDKTKEKIEFYKKFSENYLTPLFHHSIQAAQAKNISNVRFAGGRATLLTQGNGITAELYAGPEEVERDQAKKLIWLKEIAEEVKNDLIEKWKSERDSFFEQQTGILFLEQIINSTSYEQALRGYKEYKKKVGVYTAGAYSYESGMSSLDNLNKGSFYTRFLEKSGGKFMEVGFIYTSFSKTKGIELSYEPTEGLVNEEPTYKVSLSNYKLTSPILYGLSNKKASKEITPKIEIILTEEQQKQIQDLQEGNLISETPDIIDGIQSYQISSDNALFQLNTLLKTRKIDYLNIVGEELRVEKIPSTPIEQATSSPGTVSTKAGKLTKKMIIDFLTEIGFTNIQAVSELMYKGEKVKGSAYLDLINGVMQIKDGMEDYTLPEEAMHILVALIQQNRPELYDALIKDVINYKIYRETFNMPVYQTDPNYKKSNGSLDHEKIKAEAVAKLLAEFLINDLDETPARTDKISNLWNTIVNWVRNLFIKYKNPFEEVLKAIKLDATAFGEVSDLKDRDNTEDFWLSGGTLDEIDAKHPDSKAVMDTIRNRPNEENFSKIGSNYYKDGKQATFTDDDFIAISMEDLTKAAEHLEVKKISTDRNVLISQVKDSMSDRVTNLSDRYLSKLFKNRNFDEKLKDFYEQSRKDGSYLHDIAELTIQSWIDPKTGLKKPYQSSVVYPSTNPISRATAKDFSDYISNLMSQYKEGTRFLVEQIIYDKETDRFGTIDFMAILSDGTVDILDWKSMLLEDVEGAKDWKKESIFIQMNEYARILSSQYGVTKFGKIRAIPIHKIYAPDKDGVKQLVKVQVGSANAATIGEDERYLRPIISPEESTGDEYKDFLITKLGNLYQDYIKKGDFENNRTILNTIKDAIYELRVSDTKKYLGIYFTNIKQEIVELIASEKDLTTQDEVEEAYGLISYYEDIINNVIGPAISNLSLDDETSADIARIGNPLVTRKDSLHQMRERLADKGAKEKGVFGLLLPEKVVSFFAKTFRNIGSQNIATSRYAYEIIKKIYHKIDIETDDEIKKLKELKYNVDQWIKTNGVTDKEMVGKLIDFNTGGIYSKIDRMFFEKRDLLFKEGTDKQIKEFVKENYDIDAYNEDYENRLNKLKERHKLITYPGGKEEDARVKRNAISNFKSANNITSSPKTAFGKHNPMVFGVKNMLKDKWISKEYAELRKPGNESLIAMYDYMLQKNEQLVQAGVIEEYKAYNFFPGVRKGMADLLSINDKGVLKSTLGVIGQHYTNLKESITVDDYQYNFEGARDPTSGELLNKRFVPYISKIDNDFELKRDLALKLGIITTISDTDSLNTKIENYKNISTSNKKSFEDKLLDSRQMSFDIFNVYGLMAKEVAKETYLQQSDETLRAILRIESKKENIRENKHGVVSIVKGRPDKGNSTDPTNNYLVLKGFVEEHVEGKKLDIDSEPVVRFIVSQKLREKWNNSYAGKLYKFDTDPDSLKPVNISVVKFAMMVNSANQKRILGLNLASAISNFFGGNFAANKLYQKYASKADLHKAHTQLTSGAFYQSEDMKKRAALLDYVLPYLNNRESYKASQLSINDAAKFFSQDWLMSPMRRTSEIVQANIFLAVIDNTGIINGKLVNLRVEAGNNLQYKNRFNVTETERRQIEKEFEARVVKYKQDYSLTKVAQYKTVKESGKDKVILDLPGFSRESQDIQDLREIVQTMSKDALGEADEYDTADYKRSITWRMFMTFKNWIPRQADVRFGEFRLDQAHHAYEYGRFRMFWRSLNADIFQTIVKLVPLPYITGKLTDAAFSKEAIIQKAKEVYEEKMKQEKLFGRYNSETFISQDEFIAKFIQGSESTYAELRTLILMSILLMFGLAAADDDDSPSERAFKTLIRRQLSKLQDEVGFFYSPKSAIDIGGGGVPVAAMIRDYWFVMTNLSGQFFGYSLEGLGFEETGVKMQEKAYPIKRIFKIFPVLKEILTYLPAISDDLAKDWGVKITEQRGQ